MSVRQQHGLMKLSFIRLSDLNFLEPRKLFLINSEISSKCISGSLTSEFWLVPFSSIILKRSPTSLQLVAADGHTPFSV